MRYTDNYYYDKLHFGYYDLKKFLKHLTPNEQAFIISKYGRNMRYESIMNKFNLNLFQLNIIKHSAELKMTLLITKKLLSWQAKEVEKIKSVVYPELTEEEYDNYIWDENEDLTEAYFSGAYSKESVTDTKANVIVESKEVKQTTNTKPDESKKVEPPKEKTASKKRNSRKGVISVSEEDKLKIIQNLKYFNPIKQLCLITGYELFGETNLNLTDIAGKFGLTPGRVSQIKKIAVEEVNKFVLGDNSNLEQLKTKGEYVALTKDTYMDYDSTSQTKQDVTKQIKVERNQGGAENKNAEQSGEQFFEHDADQQKILDIMKYFSKAEQICLVYGYGLFGVKKGDKKQLKKHFRDDFNLNTIFTKTIRKKRVLTKPVESLTAQEFAIYQEVISTTYNVLDESYFNKKKVTNTTDDSKKPLIKATIVNNDISKLTYLMPKIQYVLLANLGIYDKKLTLQQIANSLGYTVGQIARYKSYGEMCIKILMSEEDCLTDEEKETYNQLINNNYGLLSKEQFFEFPRTFVKKGRENLMGKKETPIKEKSANDDDKRKTNKGRRLVLPDYFNMESLVHFPVKDQVIMFLVYGLEDTNSYALAKVAEAVNVQTNTVRKYIDDILGQMQILNSPYEELNYADRRVYDSLINKKYYKIDKENLFDYIPNKNSEIYFARPKATDLTPQGGGDTLTI